MSGADSPSMATVSDDELGSYRSLSIAAVLSLVFGLLSVLAFAPWKYFLWTFPPLAIATGLLALRQIRAAPEVWTGRRLARAGIALAVICGTVAATGKFYTTQRIKRQGRAVADRFVDKLKQGDLESAFWLTLPRESRREFETKEEDDMPNQLIERYVSTRTELGAYAEALASGEATMEYEKVEEAATEHGVEYAAVLYKFRSPKEDMHVLIVASSVLSHETHEPTWFVREQRFGYQPRSFTIPAVSGHGHSH